MSTVTDSAAFRSFTFYTGILMVKLFGMAILTSMVRMRKKVLANPEDRTAGKEKFKVSWDDPDVERVRRAHRNDVENILPFFALGLLYCCTQPNPGTAIILFSTFTLSRIAHTLVYAIFPVNAIVRFSTFAVGLGVNFYMSISIIAFFA